MNERELQAALGEAADVDPAARERSWRVVQRAYASARPRPRRRRGPVVAVVLAAAAFAVVAVGAMAARGPRVDVGQWVRGIFGVAEQPARRALVRVPGGGTLLVQAGGSVWVVSADGGKRRLGSYSGASWSPHGLFVLAWRGGVLTATDPRGRARWSVARPDRVTGARWGPVDGFRVAYLSGGALRIVNGDGTGDRRYGAADERVAPSWRPDRAHVLAYVDPENRITAVAADEHRVLWRSAPLRGLLELAWSARGDRLLALAADRVALFSRSGRLVASRRIGPELVAQRAAWAPRGDRLAVVRRSTGTGLSELVLLTGRLSERVVFSGPGRFGAPAWSPSGSHLLLPWPETDQWLFLRMAGRGRLTPIANIAAQFGPGVRQPSSPASVAWCCGTPPTAPAPAAPGDARQLLRREPSLGVACRKANSIACDRVGLGVWLKRPAVAVSAAVNGGRLRLHAGGFGGRGPTYWEGYLQPAGMLGGRLDVTPDRGRYFWEGRHPRDARVELTVRRRDGSVAHASLVVALRPGWG